MKEHPILFSSEMVKALLDGKKTQTRRVIKPQPVFAPNYQNTTMAQPTQVYTWTPRHNEIWYAWKDWNYNFDLLISNRCPYGQVGDRLWVRETCYLPTTGWTDTNSDWHSRIYQMPDLVKYVASSEPVSTGWYDVPIRYCLIKKPSIFMPRWASRITLEITDVKVQRVQDISEDDAEAEGLKEHMDDFQPGASYWVSANEKYKELWDKINGKKYPWSSNPWVWAISFKVIK